MSTGNSKVVFVGNVPYNMTEEQLVGIFKSVGQVVGFRLVFDRDTAKPKGYGFCEFADHETALSAVRNLNNTDCGGRPLRIDLADSDPFLEGKTTVRGEILDGGYPGPSEPRAQWRAAHARPTDPEAFLGSIPPGKPVPKGASALDSISNTLAGISHHHLMDVLSQMKSFVIAHPEQARTLLIKHPQFSYALFQALVLNNIVDPAILERMLASSRGSPGGGGGGGPLSQTPATAVPPPGLGANRPPLSALPPHLQHHVPPTSSVSSVSSSSSSMAAGAGAQYPPPPALPAQMPPFPPQGAGLQHPQPVPVPMQAMSSLQPVGGSAAGMPPPPPGMMPTPPVSAMFSHLQAQPQVQVQAQVQAQVQQPPPTSATTFYRPPPTSGVQTQMQMQQQQQTLVQPQQVQPTPPAAAPEISEAQRTMLMQVLSMSQEQINALGDTERTAIMELRTRFGTMTAT